MGGLHCDNVVPGAHVTPAQLRAALGSFPTGVTVVTACTPHGRKAGVTANSFNSVSLDPPLVLWSLARSSASLPVFTEATHWGVHILASNQQWLSERFALGGTDKFAGLSHGSGLGGIPLLKDCAATLQCTTRQRIEAGDHYIFIGEVQALQHSASASLVYQRGRYARAVEISP